MCGRFTLKTTKGIPLKYARHPALDEFAPRYNIAPSQDIVAIVQHESQPEATLLKWGLIPSWSKEPRGIINARVETLDEKPSFSESFRNRRCLILADGFYEWDRIGKISQPYYFQMKDAAPFAMAGIWDRWKQNGQSLTSCAIITTTANELLATIHHRMPAILQPDAYDLWLNESSRSADLKEFLNPFPANDMKSHAVSYDVNNTKLDHEDLLREVEPNIGVTLSLFD